MRRRVTNVEFALWSRGWACEITFRLATARQFTDEVVTVRGVSESRARWGFLVAWWRAWGVMRRTVRLDGAKPGERKAKGWCD